MAPIGKRVTADVAVGGSEFGWFDTWVAQYLGTTLTFGRSVPENEMLRAIGANDAAMIPQTLWEACGDPQTARVRVGTRTGWTYLIEQFTVRGSDHEVLCNLSRAHSEAVALCYTQTISSFSYARNGELVDWFDMTVPELGHQGTDPHSLDAPVAAAGFSGSEHAAPSAGLHLVQLAFGIKIDQEMLEARLPIAPLPQ